MWCTIAETNAGEAAGHVAFLPSALSRWPAEQGTAHFWQLFVRPPFWGTGVAPELHRRAVRAASERGFEAMRLFTPAGQDRARRFYEREGWRAAGAPFEDNEFGLPLVEYRLTHISASGG